MDIHLPKKFQRIIRRLRTALEVLGGRPHRGFALLSAALLLILVMAFGMTVVNFSMTTSRSNKVAQLRLTAEQIAEAGVNRAVACLNAVSGANCGGFFGTAYPGEVDVTFGGGSFTTIVTGSGELRSVISVGLPASGPARTVQTDVTRDPIYAAATNFDFALQAGDAGVIFQNGADINDGSIWSNADVLCGNNSDIDQDVYVAKPDGVIDNCRLNGDAHADRILNSTIQGDAWYRSHPADFLHSSAEGVEHRNSATPESKPLPTVDYPFWRRSAEEGGLIVGDFAPGDNSTLGPVKITGNLILNNGVDVTMTGPIWVVGNVTMTQNSSLTLHPGYDNNSSVLLADNPVDNSAGGAVLLENNVVIRGSGQPNSFVYVISTNNSLSDTLPALQVSNNAEGGIFLAPNGVARLNNNAAVTIVAGRRVYLDQNSDVYYRHGGYDPSQTSLSTVTGDRWRLKPGTWREIR
ncbi:hypothetical protein A3C96_00690 [Candidatus Uhrbacteria bacterium RIFCSPHIGHO2_02_FULL_60_10]|uniref:Uncharacterized protein n=1 Tax=Candidatus Uhrbacteria bacterium RIFCSPHIGHO2_02_FULL_60_10 TaxID=1802392 RepID=A0A1F7U724_9BACT|nr:MAG: hypothetical protein A3C96_00690 [Candidatus Uhrbacteria bacterium RIFCSPHIGHO2_02_FULL_60_10]